MAWHLGRVTGGLVPALGVALSASFAAAQSPAGASFPPDPAPAPAPAPSPAAPAPAPAPAPAAPPAAPAAASAPAAAPAPAAPAPPPAEAPPPQPYQSDLDARPGYGATYGDPPPPPAPPEKDSQVPPFSVRLDPLNLILFGRMGVELELGIPGLPQWMTIETVPMFVVNDTPPLLDFSRYDVNIAQHSGGLGPLAGATLGVNFWLSGKRPLKGSFLGVGITNYTIDYESFEADGTTRADFVSHTERQLYFFYGSMARYGAFIIGGGIGFGYDVNKEIVCVDGTTKCDAIQLAVPDPGIPTRSVPFDVTGFIYPWDIMTRFSLGVAID